MTNIFVIWLGNSDLGPCTGEAKIGLGPIGEVVSEQSFTHVVVISNYKE